MCKVLAISCSKGGVGKTTSAVNIGIGLAYSGKKVLLLDVDGQGDMSKSLGVDDPESLDYTIARAMVAVANGEDADPREGILTHMEGVDFLPANSRLSALDKDLASIPGSDTVLKNLVECLKPDYDFVQRFIFLSNLSDQLLRLVDINQKEPMDFLLYMYKQDEEEFLELMDALEMIYECIFALATYTDMEELDRQIVEVSLQLYVEDVAEFYRIYATVKKLMGAELEGLVAGVKELLKFYNALQVRYEGERILFSDNIWKRFEKAEQELVLPDNLP